MGRDREEGGGKLVGGRGTEGCELVDANGGGTVGSRVRWQFFLLEFSKGNDLRYISKGFLLVGKRVRRRYPPNGEATACPPPPPLPLVPLVRPLPPGVTGQFAFLNH